MFTQI